MESDQKFNVLMLALPQLSSVGFVSIMLNEIKADTTIGQVIELIRKQTSYQKIQNFSCYGLKQELSKKINDLIPQLQVNNPRFTVEVQIKCQEISIKIESVTGGKIANLSIGRDEKVIEIKNKLQSQCKYSIEAQKLFYKDQEIDDEKPLSYYNFKDECTLELSLTQGKSLFANLEQQPLQIKIKKEGDPWRKGCLGLNLEGHCKNRICRAYEQSIIGMQYFSTFNLKKQKLQCPQCSEFVEPESCGFYKCQWFYQVQKADGCFSSNIKEVRDEDYHRFSEKDNKEEGELLIVAMPLINQCQICYKDISLFKSRTTNCNHIFHNECLNNLSKFLRDQRRPTLCPICKNVLD